MTLAAGTKLGPYEILALIGAGGMGEVYCAMDTKLNREVAVKVISSELADSEARHRFQLEARLASSLNHPHILTVHDAGEFEGKEYLVTEFIDGGTLRDWSRAQPRGWRDVVELLAGVADGVAAAHDAGILHRDIKPQNVLVTKSGYAKLADFGLAKLLERISQEDETRTLEDGITRPGIALGTTAYMSPEQASGKHLDARTDVFSFGVLLYEALGSKRPFTGSTGIDVLHAIINANPEPLDDSVPPALRVIVTKALEKKPADRYQSMREMVGDLRRLLRRQDSLSDTSMWLQKPAIAAVAAVLLAVAVWRFWPAAAVPPIR